FVRHKIQGKIKRGDAQNRTKREPPDDRPAPSRRRLPVERQPLSTDARSFFGRDLEGENSAVHFGAGCLDGLARFERHQKGKFFVACSDTFRYFTQNVLALVAGHLARGLKGALSGRNRSFGVGSAGTMCGAHHRAVVRSENFQRLALGEPFAIEEKSPNLSRSLTWSGHSGTS